MAITHIPKRSQGKRNFGEEASILILLRGDRVGLEVGPVPGVKMWDSARGATPSIDRKSIFAERGQWPARAGTGFRSGRVTITRQDRGRSVTHCVTLFGVGNLAEFVGARKKSLCQAT